MKRRDVLISADTIIVCITALVCTIILSLAILKANRYANDGQMVIDKYKNEVVRARAPR